MTAGTRVRAALPVDRPALVAFMVALQEHERAMQRDREPGPRMADAHLAYLERSAAEGGAVLVAEHGGETVGFAVVLIQTSEEGDVHLLESERRFGWVSDLYVLPERRREGVAGALLDAAAEHCRAAGLPALLIASLTGNLPALRSYRAAGFEPYEISLRKPL